MTGKALERKLKELQRQIKADIEASNAHALSLACCFHGAERRRVETDFGIMDIIDRRLKAD